MPFETGPYLQMAVFCEKVLEEKDGVLSVIRIIDRFIHTAIGPTAPEAMPPVPINPFIAISLKAGQARGSNTMTIRPEKPSGVKLPGLSVPLFFEADDRGVNFYGQMSFQLDQEGLYWFDLLIGDQLLTRIPLRIVYQRLSTGPGQPTGTTGT